MEDNENVYRFLLEEYKRTNKFSQTNKTYSHVNTTNIKGYTPYPGVQSSEFNTLITKKKEFWDIQGRETGDISSFESESSTRCNPTVFKVAPHQIFVKRFLSPQTPYHGLLLFHDVGVGKTCTAISIAEQYINLYDKRVLVILSSTLRDNFKKQIFDITKYDMETHTANLCTGNRYADLVVDRQQMTADDFAKAVEKIIHKHYQFMGYKELFELCKKIREHIEKTERDQRKHESRYKEKIAELFSDRLIIIDEAHNLRSTADEVDKRISQAFMDMVNNAKNIKILLMTATPMFNDPREIVWLLNILLTNDQRPTLQIKDLFDKTGLLTTAGRKRLEDNCTGYVSYMRGENPYSFPFRIYPKDIDDKHLIRNHPEYDMLGNRIASSQRSQNIQLIGSPLSPSQLMVYEDMLHAIPATYNEDEIEESASDKTSLQVQNLIQVCNCVFPMTSSKITYGSVGFGQCFDRNKNKISYNGEVEKKYGQFLKYDGHLGKYAPKIKRIIDYVLKAQGIVFIYSQFYYSGIIPIALALEHIGFNKRGGNLGVSLDIEQRIPLIGGKRPNYVILSRDAELSPNNNKEIALLRSKENCFGDHIKVVIVSKIGTEGLDLKNIREMHLLDPWYNLNRAEQIIGRGVRTCSHIDLPKEQRNVLLFFHAVTYPDDELESFDQRVYRIAEAKQKNINKVEQVLKSHAIDCSFNYPNLTFPVERLNIKFDIETSQGITLKDFKVGDKDQDLARRLVKCATTSSAIPRDTSTFSKAMIIDEIDIYKGYIASTFKGVTRNTYKDIRTLLQGKFKMIDDDILKYALDEMVENHEVFLGYNHQRGSLMFAGNKYIFKPFLDIIEFDRKSRIPLDALISREDVPIASAKSLVHSLPKNQHILEHIQKQVDEVTSLTGDKYLQYNVDYVIDRLSTEEFAALISIDITSAPIPSLVDASIKTMKSLLYDHTRKIIGFYNFRDSKFYLKKNGVFIEATPLDLTKWTQNINEIRASLVTTLPEWVSGYLQAKSNDVCKFKVRDGKTMGYVCAQTHSLQVEELRRRIMTLDPTILDKQGKLTKVKLCTIYEILMRHIGKFLRPQMMSLTKI
jgi:hypothetical protein